MLKKFFNFLTSLKFGILLFLIIAAYSIIGTVLPQGVSSEYYLQHYPAFGYLILSLQLDRVYSSVIFMAIVAVFIINLTGCTMKILPAQLNRMKDSYIPQPKKNSTNLYEKTVNLQAFRQGLKKKGYKIIERGDGYCAAKNRIGNIGSTVTHLGIIVIIMGAVLGNLFAQDGSVSLAPGEEAVFEKNGFSVVVDDFYMEFRDDNSINQYFSELSVYENGEKVKEETIWVNNPLSFNGLDLYQSYYGWESHLEILDAEGEALVHNQMEDNSHYYYEPAKLRVYLYGFFPDFVMDSAGNPGTRSQKMNNPHFAVVLYDYDVYVDSYIVKPGEAIEYLDLSVVFTDPVLYTGIVYRQDKGYPFVFAGAVLMVLGLLLSFYFSPRYVYVAPGEIVPIAAQNSWGHTYTIKAMLQGQKNKKGEAE